ncbi:cardiolipin synthetase [Oceaniovalibus guishaninsula JLT2003]|uniref:Cardiolipin synthase n=1 Tax=Oceaniovalibus guishaninsula JLT2003 TaxID=1231392 RepID=K2H8T2_9RHOB|nr:cardiolipin synthase [Oceaniovalibus guishaninsula]EKE43988.1 cardiolipin synthetase [Oceaniovalibus guishaninsula JLT2003]
MTLLLVLSQILLVLAGTAVAFAALKAARTPQGASAWVVFLVSFPHLAIIAFLLFGRVGFTRMVRRRRASDAAALHKAEEDARHGIRPRLETFARIADDNAAGPNGVKVLIDGDATFAAIFDAIAAARTYVLVQTYILRDDALGRRLRDALLAAEARGVTTKLLYDRVGCIALPRAFVENLRRGGVAVEEVRGTRRWLTRLSVNFRNHRKIVVVDGKVGFLGGLNMAQEYVDGGSAFDRWRDTHLRIEGPLVVQLERVFERDWFWTTGHRIVAPHRTDPPEGATAWGVILPSGPSDAIERGSLFLCGMCGEARSRLWLASPYLVPDNDLVTALQLAALRGVDVRILVPARADHRLPWIAARSYFDDLRRTGVRIFEYKPGFMHQKVILADHDLVSIGSVNLDVRSAMINFEVTAVMEDGDLGQTVNDMLERDFAQAREVTQWLKDAPAWLRVAAPVARLFAPVI